MSGNESIHVPTTQSRPENDSGCLVRRYRIERIVEGNRAYPARTPPPWPWTYRELDAADFSDDDLDDAIRAARLGNVMTVTHADGTTDQMVPVIIAQPFDVWQPKG